jgi:glycosyltransferase involved in cell wall biosynthesis
MPEYKELDSVEGIRAKSSVLYPGMVLDGLDDMARGAGTPSKDDPPLILWNHRWEYDKNPEVFFKALYVMQDKGLDFEVAILGENFSNSPEVFEEARKRLGARIVHFGFVKSRAEYAQWLARADVAPVTSNHDFFGCSVVEAIYMKCFPILPKRLAYPEHIPKALRERCFYRDFDGLCSRLEAAIKGVADIRESDMLSEMRGHVARYDWFKMVGIYDDEMERIVQGMEITA